MIITLSVSLLQLQWQLHADELVSGKGQQSGSEWIFGGGGGNVEESSEKPPRIQAHASLHTPKYHYAAVVVDTNQGGFTFEGNIAHHPDYTVGQGLKDTKGCHQTWGIMQTLNPKRGVLTAATPHQSDVNNREINVSLVKNFKLNENKTFLNETEQPFFSLHVVVVAEAAAAAPSSCPCPP